MKYSFPQIFVEFCDKIWPCWELNVITFKKKKKKRKKKRKLIKSWCRYYSHTTFYYTSFLLYTRRVDALRYVTSLLREIFFLLFFFSVNLLLIDNILRGINFIPVIFINGLTYSEFLSRIIHFFFPRAWTRSLEQVDTT